MTLTDNEKAVLDNILFNDFGAKPNFRAAEYKFNPHDFQVWSDCIGDSTSVFAAPTGKALSGTVASLIKKGLLTSDSECVTFTEAGFRAATTEEPGGVVVRVQPKDRIRKEGTKHLYVVGVTYSTEDRFEISVEANTRAQAASICKKLGLSVWDIYQEG